MLVVRPPLPRYTHSARAVMSAKLSRLLSSSYAPRPGEPTHDETIAELLAVFDRYATSGTVAMLYATVVVLGRPR